MATAVKTYQQFIGGEWIDSTAGETEADINPATEQAVAEIQVGTREDADRAVAAAQKAYDEIWLDTPPKERSAMMLKLADAMDADTDELARLESIDVGKPISVSSAESRSSPTTSDSSPARPECRRASPAVSTSGVSRA